jgi:hypothetical protein
VPLYPLNIALASSIRYKHHGIKFIFRSNPMRELSTNECSTVTGANLAAAAALAYSLHLVAKNNLTPQLVIGTAIMGGVMIAGAVCATLYNRYCRNN